jgi:hypothetical protein
MNKNVTEKIEKKTLAEYLLSTTYLLFSSTMDDGWERREMKSRSLGRVAIIKGQVCTIISFELIF